MKNEEVSAVILTITTCGVLLRLSRYKTKKKHLLLFRVGKKISQKKSKSEKVEGTGKRPVWN